MLRPKAHADETRGNAAQCRDPLHQPQRRKNPPSPKRRRDNCPHKICKRGCGRWAVPLSPPISTPISSRIKYGPPASIQHPNPPSATWHGRRRHNSSPPPPTNPPHKHRPRPAPITRSPSAASMQRWRNEIQDPPSLIRLLDDIGTSNSPRRAIIPPPTSSATGSRRGAQPSQNIYGAPKSAPAASRSSMAHPPNQVGVMVVHPRPVSSIPSAVRPSSPASSDGRRDISSPHK